LSKKARKGKKVPIGRFSSPHGVRGEIKFRPYEGVEDFIWEEVFVSLGGSEKSIEVLKVREHTGCFLLTLGGYGQREESAALSGVEVLVPEDTLPELEEGEYYYKDLVGLEVRTDDGRGLGHIKEVFAAGPGNEVFEVQGPYGEVLLPVTEETILEVNIEKGFVLVHLLEGLLDEGG
jgi:16S rRNA processing protein RimM